MPYINEARRRELSEGEKPESTGELNYKITTACLEYLKITGESYSSFNEVAGVLECAKLEFYRRMVAPYEDVKIKANGDLY